MRGFLVNGVLIESQELNIKVVPDANAHEKYVAITGSDATGDGTEGRPWKTIKYALTEAVAGDVIKVGAGGFIENGQIEVPSGVSIIGMGKNQTTIKAAASFHYNPDNPGYAEDRYIIALKGMGGNQNLKGFTIDGDSKKLHGGIFIHGRDNVVIDDVKVLKTNFNGIWLWHVKDCKILNTCIVNCSWGSTGWVAGALQLGNMDNVEIANLNLDENVGYGIKAIGPDGYFNISNLKIHDSRISVIPTGLWENNKAPNIAIELWQCNLKGCEIYNCYVDNTISLVNNEGVSDGVQTIRVHHNVLDMATRANGAGYGIELTVHDVEIDHNYFIKGNYGIANWHNAMKNWDIHHNTFYALAGQWPGDVVRAQSSKMENVKFHNNTIEFTGDRTINVFGFHAPVVSDKVAILNNLFINNNTAYSFGANKLIHLESVAVVDNLEVKNNWFDRLSIGNVPGTYLNNPVGDPKIIKSGERPSPYYEPMPGSPLIALKAGAWENII